MTAPAKLEVVELRAGQVWVPAKGSQPRTIMAIGVPTRNAIWFLPKEARSQRHCFPSDFRAWIRRHRATLATKEGGA